MKERQRFQETIDVIERYDTLRFGLFDEPYPYIVPLSYGYEFLEQQVILYVYGSNIEKNIK